MSLTWDQYVDKVYSNDPELGQMAKDNGIFSIHLFPTLLNAIAKDGINFETLKHGCRRKPEEGVGAVPVSAAAAGVSAVVRALEEKNLDPVNVVKASPTEINSFIDDADYRYTDLAVLLDGFNHTHMEKLGEDHPRFFSTERVGGIVGDRLKQLVKNRDMREAYLNAAHQAFQSRKSASIPNEVIRTVPDLNKDESKWFLDSFVAPFDRWHSAEVLTTATSQKNISPEFVKELIDKPYFYNSQDLPAINDEASATTKKVISEYVNSNYDPTNVGKTKPLVKGLMLLASDGTAGLGLEHLSPDVIRDSVASLSEEYSDNNSRFESKLSDLSDPLSQEQHDAVTQGLIKANQPAHIATWISAPSRVGKVKVEPEVLGSLYPNLSSGDFKYDHIADMSKDEVERFLGSVKSIRPPHDLANTVAVWERYHPNETISPELVQRVTQAPPDLNSVDHDYINHAIRKQSRGEVAEGFDPDSIIARVERQRETGDPYGIGFKVKDLLDLPQLTDKHIAFIASPQNRGMFDKGRENKLDGIPYTGHNLLDRLAHPNDSTKNVFNGQNGMELGVKVGSSALRHLRDYLDQQHEQGVASVRPESLPAGQKWNTVTRDIVDKRGNVQSVIDWNPLRDNKFGGNLTADKVRQHIDAMPEAKVVAVDGGEYTHNLQSHSNDPNRITIFNLHPETIERLRQNNLLHIFTTVAGLNINNHFDVHYYTENYMHPHTPYTLGWMRHTEKRDNKQIFIDEIQSDTLSNFRAFMKSDKVPDHVKQKAQAAMDMVFGKAHPSELLVEAGHQMFRDKNRDGWTVSMHSSKSKGTISLEDHDKDEPVHFKVTYDEVPKKMGAKPSTYGQREVETPRSGYEDIKGMPVTEMKLPKHETFLLDLIKREF